MDKTITILLAEDNPADIVLLNVALEQAGLTCRMQVARDGTEVLGLLSEACAAAGSGRPDLIVLDHNLPKKNGLEVYTEIRDNPVCSGIPVVVLSGARLEPGLVEAYGLPESHYFVKPPTFLGYVDMVKRITPLINRKP